MTGSSPEDYRAELRRLGASLVTRTIQHSYFTHSVTDRQLTSILRRIEVTNEGCWRWTGHRGKRGYGQFSMTSGGKVLSPGAHRLMYMLLRGPIPAGLTLDHLCRVRECVNPHHLDPCDISENCSRSSETVSSINRAKKMCPKGHPYDITYVDSSGYPHRSCGECNRDRARSASRRRRAEL